MTLLPLTVVIGFLVFALPARAAEPCHMTGYLGTDYAVCIFDPAKDDIRIFHADDTAKPYGGFLPLARDLWQRGKHVLRFAVNGGMYHPDMSPVGLYVEKSVEKKPLVTGGGWGNFFLLPNGVFYLGGGKAGVMETEAFKASGVKADYATQSGPMLVTGGKLHPAFLPNSDSLKIRNGVGVDAQGRVVFVVSRDPVRFYDLAVFYRDVLGCNDALFLDGTISSLLVPEWRRRDDGYPLGTIIGVVRTLP